MAMMDTSMDDSMRIVPVDMDDNSLGMNNNGVGMFMERVTIGRTLPKILCCECGVEIDPNPANTCVNCLRKRVDITEGIPKSLILHQCRGCARILRPPWVSCELESRELLAVCLKKITGLNKVKLIDAGFIWTEPHSRRLKVKLTVQKEVLNGVKLQQVFPVEFVLQNQQCDACARSYTDHVWRAMVQVRQKVGHKRTFLLLEQLILKHGAHEKCISVEQQPSGVDFAFSERSHAVKFIDFLGAMVPTRSKAAKQLISEDIQNGEKKYKFSYAVEIVPLCKDDVVLLPKATAAALGNISRLCLVLRVAANVGLLDPRSLQLAELSSERYWRAPFRSVLSSTRLEEFVVLDITPVTIAPITGTALRRKQGAKGRKGRPAARERLEALKSLSATSAPTTASTTASGKRSRVEGAVSVATAASVHRSNAVGGGGSSSFTGRSGGFTGGVSLAGGSVSFTQGGGGNGGASTVASTVVGGFRGRMLLADAEVMRARDMGVSDARFIVRTHLGNILRPGDSVLGYDLSKAVFTADDEGGEGGEERFGSTSKGSRTANVGCSTDAADDDEITASATAAASLLRTVDIILVRKVYPRTEDRVYAEREIDGAAAAAAVAATERTRTVDALTGDDLMNGASAAAPPVTTDASVSDSSRRRNRVWKLKRFNDVVWTSTGNGGGNDDSGKGIKSRAAAAVEERESADFEAFLRDIEEDPVLRKSINLYKDADAVRGRQETQRLQQQQSTKPSVHERKQTRKNDTDADADENEDGDDEKGNEGGLLEIGLEELLDDLNIDEATAKADQSSTHAEIHTQADTAQTGSGSAEKNSDSNDAVQPAKDQTTWETDDSEHYSSQRESGKLWRRAKPATNLSETTSLAAGKTIPEEEHDEEENDDESDHHSSI